MANSDDCTLCGCVIPDLPWNKYADLCPECDARAMQRMTHAERKVVQWQDWEWFLDDTEDVVVPGADMSEWSDEWDWDWNDWLAACESETIGTASPGVTSEYAVYGR